MQEAPCMMFEFVREVSIIVITDIYIVARKICSESQMKISLCSYFYFFEYLYYSNQLWWSYLSRTNVSALSTTVSMHLVDTGHEYSFYWYCFFIFPHTNSLNGNKMGKDFINAYIYILINKTTKALTLHTCQNTVALIKN